MRMSRNPAMVAAAFALAGAVALSAGAAEADHEKRKSYYKARKVTKPEVTYKPGENFFTCRYNCGDQRREGLNWWQHQAEQRGGGNERVGR